MARWERPEFYLDKKEKYPSFFFFRLRGCTFKSTLRKSGGSETKREKTTKRNSSQSRQTDRQPRQRPRQQQQQNPYPFFCISASHVEAEATMIFLFLLCLIVPVIDSGLYLLARAMKVFLFQNIKGIIRVVREGSRESHMTEI